MHQDKAYLQLAMLLTLFYVVLYRSSCSNPSQYLSIYKLPDRGHLDNCYRLALRNGSMPLNLLSSKVKRGVVLQAYVHTYVESLQLRQPFIGGGEFIITMAARPTVVFQGPQFSLDVECVLRMSKVQ